MNKNDDNDWLLNVIIIVIAFGFLTFCIFSTIIDIKKPNAIEQLGVESRKNGVSADANPYQGDWWGRGELWLKGWIKGK